MATEAEKLAAQAERAKIAATVTSSKKPDVEKEEEVEVEEKDDATTDKEDDKEGEQDKEDSDKEGDDDGEDKEEVEEKVEISPEVAKLNKTIERLQRRVGKTTGEKAAIAKELQDAKVALAAKAIDGGLTEEEVDRRATIKAKEIATNDAFEAAKAKLAKSALKADKDFTSKIMEIAEEVGGIPGAMIGILEDLDNENGGAVLAFLANNPDEYEEVIGFGLTKMSNRLNKLSDKILEEGKVKPKLKSKVPPPIDPIKGSTESPNLLPTKPNKDKETMEKFVKLRQQQEAERRKMRYG